MKRLEEIERVISKAINDSSADYDRIDEFSDVISEENVVKKKEELLTERHLLLECKEILQNHRHALLELEE